MPTTSHSGIFRMHTVFHTPSCMVAFCKVSLIPVATHFVQPDGASTFSKDSICNCNSSSESKLPTNYSCIVVRPTVITDGTPSIVVKYFYSTRKGCGSINQTYLKKMAINLIPEAFSNIVRSRISVDKLYVS